MSNDIVNNLAFLPLDLPEFVVSNDLVERLNRLYVEDSINDEYRNCKHIPIYITDGKDAKNYQGNHNLTWSKQSESLPEVVEYIKTNIFPWANPMGRIMIICTKTKESNPVHIDCSPDKFNNTLQHKFRVVLNGRVDSLYFVNDNDSVRPTEIGNRPFMMSGSWPHGMNNDNDQMKFTLAMGAPWESNLTDEYVDLINRSYAKYSDNYLSKKGWNLPENHINLFNNKIYNEKTVQEQTY